MVGKLIVGLTLTAAVILTGINIIATSLTNTEVKPVADTSFIKTLILSRTGDPGTNELWFSLNMGNITNTFDSRYGSFDNGFSYGINLPGGPNYNPLNPTLGYGFEGRYVTAEQAGTSTFDMEHYLIALANMTNSFDRPMACLFRSDVTNGGFHYSQVDWNFDVHKFAARNGDTDTTHIRGIGPWLTIDSRDEQMILANGGNLSFTGNTNPNYWISANGNSVVRQFQYGVTGFGDRSASGTNAIWLLPGQSLQSYNPTIVVGNSNDTAAIRFKGNGLPHRWEFSKQQYINESLGTLTFVPFASSQQPERFTNTAAAVSFVEVVSGLLTNTGDIGAGGSLWSRGVDLGMVISDQALMIQDLQARIVALEQKK